MEVYKLLVMQLQQKNTCSGLNVTVSMECLHNMYCEIVLNSSEGLICLLFCLKVSCGHPRVGLASLEL